MQRFRPIVLLLSLLLLPSALLAQIPAAPLSAATQYTPPTQQPWTPPAALAPLYEVANTASQHFGRRVVPDAQLAQAAAQLLGAMSSDPTQRALTYDSTRTLLNAVGIADHDVTYQWWRQPGSPEQLTRELIQALTSAGNIASDRVGIAQTSTPSGTQLVLAFCWRNAVLSAPVPRIATVGSSVQSSVRLLNGFRDAWLSITEPNGRVRNTALATGTEPSFQATLSSAGRWQFEVSATGSVGSRPVLNFFVYADAPAELRPTFRARTLAETTEQVEARLRALINTDRERAGLAPLQADEALARIARAHSNDMVTNHFEGHRSPTTGEPADRVRTAGVRTRIVLENLTAGSSSDDVHSTLMSSPGHRAAILDPRVTNVGVGAVLRRDPGGPVVVVTEVFTTVTPPMDVTRAPQLVLDRINTERTRRGAPALELQGALSQYATTFSQRYFRNEADAPSLQRSMAAGLSATNIPMLRSSVLFVPLSSLEELTLQEWLLQPHLTVAGIGVSQGTREQGPPNELALAIVLIENTLRPLDTPSAERSLFASINAERARRNAPPLSLHPRLTEFVREGADGFFRGRETYAEVQSRLNRTAASTGVRFHRALVLMAPTAAPHELATQSFLLDPSLRSIGLAIAQGSRNDTLHNQLLVGLMVTD